MRIQTRLLLVAAAVAIPQIVGLAWWDSSSRHSAAEAALTGILTRELDDPTAGARCAADPTFGGRIERRRHHHPEPDADDVGRPPPPRHRVDPPELRVYSVTGEPRGHTHPLPVDLDTLGDGAVHAATALPWSHEVVVAARTDWDGPCGILVVRGSTTPGFLGSIVPASPVWVIPPLLVASVMLLAVGPLVRRVRRLTQAVERGEHPVAPAGDDEIAGLGHAFDRAHDALSREAAARAEREAALRRFVADTAHDVRIPLTVLRGHLTALADGPDPDALRQAMNEADYLGKLLDDLAARARMEDARPPEPVELGPLVSRVAARHTPLARRAEISLLHGIPEEPTWMLGDLTLLEQALSNLVHNAIRHNHAGGHVAITLDVDGDRFELAVRDDGPGVSHAELTRLRERGFRGEEARGRDGQGLGLAIVSRVAERHGLTFELASPEEGGLLATLSGPTSSPPR